MRVFHWEVVILALIALVGYFAAIDDRPTYKDLTTTILRQPYVDGGALVYRWKGTVTRNCRGLIRREIRQNGQPYWLPSGSYSFLPSDEWHGFSDQDFIVHVPIDSLIDELKAGPASYHVTLEGFCNQIQYLLGIPVEEKSPPIEFIITKRSS